MRFVTLKTDAQQIVLSLHRLRAAGRPRGDAQGVAGPDAMCGAKTRLPVMLMDSPDEQHRRVLQRQAHMALVERRLSQQMRESPACKAVAEIPGIGLFTATAVVASKGTPTALRDAREFAAWIGLVSRWNCAGGRVQKWGISKRGDAYVRRASIPLRTLFWCAAKSTHYPFVISMSVVWWIRVLECHSMSNEDFAARHGRIALISSHLGGTSCQSAVSSC